MGVRRWSAALLAGALVLTMAACQTGRSGDAGGGGTPGPGDGPDVPDGGEAGLVLQVRQAGGFVPMGYDFRTVPALTVYSDGQSILPGPMIEIYPGPALPNLRRIPPDTSEGADPSARVAAILAAAEDAGLLAPAPDYGMPNVTDLPTTTVTLTVGGEVYEHAAYALGFGELAGEGEATGADGLTAEQREARETLSAFLARVDEIVVGAGPDEAYAPERFAYLAYPAGEWGGDPALVPGVVPWPLEASLADAGQCAVADGEAGATLAAALAEANQLTRFEEGGTEYEVFARVLLPHERTCADLGIG